MDRIISPLLVASGIYNTKSKDINLHLQSHPEYPSLRSITDTLDYFNISNVAVKVDKSSLPQLPKMFLAHLKGELHMDFALVQQLKDAIKVTWQDGHSNHVSIEMFKERWNGTLLAVEKNKEQKTSLIEKLTNLNVLILLPIIGILLLLWFFNSSAFYFSSLSLVGLITSYFIQKESFGIGGITVAKVCSAINTNSEGCESVIKSDQSTIFGISLGDISLVYFAFLLLISAFQSIDNYMFYAISALSLLAVAYTIYIQMVNLKKWCFLCLGISLLLICQFIILHFLAQQSSITFTFVATSLIVLTLVSTSWIAIKSLWQDSIALTESKAELLGFKRTTISSFMP